MKTILALIITISSLLAEQNIRAIIVSPDRTVLSAQIAGSITSILKRDGEYFKKKQLLAKIDCGIYEAQKEKVKVEKNIAYKQLLNNKRLSKLGSISNLEIELSRAEYHKKSADLKIADINSSRCYIYAPFNGRVVSTKVNRYQSVKPQDEIIDIISVDNLEAIAVVPATWIASLSNNQVVKLHIDELNKSIYGKIKELGAVVDPSSQTINIRVSLNKPYGNILSGMSATVYFKQ
jgi:RND family efflux transporter MFP subunit